MSTTQAGETLDSETQNAGLWHAMFVTGEPRLAAMQRFHARLSSPPRCRLCYAPFRGVGGFYLRLRGKRPAIRNPNYCNACDQFLNAYPGGAEAPLSMLFVDVRGSTSKAAAMSPSEMKNYMDGFFRSARRALFETDGFVTEFRGDCVVGTYPPGMSGPDHARKAMKAAKSLLGPGAPRAPDGSPLPIGIGVHTGVVHIGTVSGSETGNRQDVTILGDNVNIAARLSQAAAAGEALISTDTVDASGVEMSETQLRNVPIEGRTQECQAFVLRA